MSERGAGPAHWIPKILAIWGAILVVFTWGYATHRFRLFPASHISDATDTLLELKSRLAGELPHFYHPTRQTKVVSIAKPAEMAPGVTLVTGVGPERTLFARLVDPQGRTLHSWDINWWKMWPDADHVPRGKRPTEPPGMDIHGAVLASNGDLTFNFSDYGLMQVDFCGRVKWRSPHMTHHTVFADENGHFWSLDVFDRDTLDPKRPNIMPPYRDVSVVEFGPDGRLLRRFNIYGLLQRNGLNGIMYLASYDDEDSPIRGDHLHANDVDVFPASLAPGKFSAGDVMVSLRNANTIFVFDPATQKIKAMLTGQFVRQHDPDFVDGWTISVFDNHTIGEPPERRGSRIVEYDFRTGTQRTLFAGGGAKPFFTAVMGNHQRLANGDILITESQGGRAFEVNPRAEFVWEYNNLVSKGVVGDLTDAHRISPEELPPEKIRQLAASCPKTAA